MRSWSRISLVFASLGLASCGSQEVTGSSEEVARQAIKEVAKLSEADLLRVCKAGVAFRSARAIDGIDVTSQGEDIVRASYTRAADSKAFRYDCRVEGNIVRFRMIDEAGPGSGPGTWSGRGSTTTFDLKDDGVEFQESYGPGDMTTEFVRTAN